MAAEQVQRTPERNFQNNMGSIRGLYTCMGGRFVGYRSLYMPDYAINLCTGGGGGGRVYILKCSKCISSFQSLSYLCYIHDWKVTFMDSQAYLPRLYISLGYIPLV